MKILFIIGILIIILIVISILLAIFNKYLPIWFCNKMHWHLRPLDIGFDGCSPTGKCPRCGKHVLRDSQGNWF